MIEAAQSPFQSRLRDYAMTKNQPHARFQHVYVVVRVDRDLSPENAFSLVSAWRTEPEAQAEADRLIDLGASEGRDYRVVVTRMKSL